MDREQQGDQEGWERRASRGLPVSLEPQQPRGAQQSRGPRGAGAPLALIGPPGAGCRSVAGLLARARGGRPPVDLGALTARALGVEAEHALVAVPEEDYRRAEAAAAVEALAGATGSGGAAGAAECARVLALGSGWAGRQEVRRSLEAFRAGGGRVIALSARGRVLATRNGLDAPRSVALGPVHHQFIQMLRHREEACRPLADAVVDTTLTTVEQAATRVLECLAAL